MLTTAKAWELRRHDLVVIKAEHYTLTDDPKPGPPGWTRLTTSDRAGLLTIHLIEGSEPVNVVRPKDYTNQIRRGTYLDAQRRRR